MQLEFVLCMIDNVYDVEDVCKKDKYHGICRSFTKGESMQVFSNPRASNNQLSFNERESMQTFKEFIHVSFSRSGRSER